MLGVLISAAAGIADKKRDIPRAASGQVVLQQRRRLRRLQIYKGHSGCSLRRPADRHHRYSPPLQANEIGVVHARLDNQGTVHLQIVDHQTLRRHQDQRQFFSSAASAAVIATSIMKPSLAGPEETAEGIDEKSAIVLVLPVRRPRARRLGI